MVGRGVGVSSPMHSGIFSRYAKAEQTPLRRQSDCSRGGGDQITKKNREYMKKLILAFLLGAVFVVVGSGCHTAHGFGEDMQKAGDKIQEKT
jgi:predicted small secreted protein